MKMKILALAWWLSAVALGGAMDADPVSWVTVTTTLAAFITISAVIIRQQKKTT